MYDTCVLLIATYGLQTVTIAEASVEKLRVAQIVIEHTMLNISLWDRMLNTKMRRRINFTDVIDRMANLNWSQVKEAALVKIDEEANRLETSLNQKSVGRPPKEMTWRHQVLWQQMSPKMSGPYNVEKMREAYIQQCRRPCCSKLAHVYLVAKF